MQPVAIIPFDVQVTPDTLSAVTSAIQIQLSRDFVPWGRPAVCGWFSSLEQMPRGCWPVLLKRDAKGVAGFHAPGSESDQRPPFAIVQYSDDSAWTVAASHEILEMLVDPRGDFFVKGPNPADPSEAVEFLVEVCDPCQGEAFCYQVDHNLWPCVSDFCLPGYYRIGASGAPYTIRRSVQTPFSTAFGGLITYRDSAHDWWQLSGGRIARANRDSILGNQSATAWNFRGRVDRCDKLYQGPPPVKSTSRYSAIRKLAGRSQKNIARALHAELERLEEAQKLSQHNRAKSSSKGS
ncbi:hypothetical protein [Casimicrobium huifangae]|uniref:hypothetical protein n=1 Tax=Casimicrobium huifangae TaxID=2591109 RepID=UPI0012EB8103|nr:hypothetical protein [Casimicrobium huifangae]